MPVVGTAGHVDHGKSTLVQALTGRDPDRWSEEKARGLTIDLGFAWTTLPDGTEVSFVDVPGHERFIKNMLAGTDGFDVALFVVAADEGWMPQSEEHLAVLDLLGISKGVVALTKVDRVDGDLVELATLEIEEQLAGTSLAGSPIVPVAAPEQVGLEELKLALSSALSEASSAGSGRPRMWVDRAFTIAGAGTVVTGTLTGAPLAVGDLVEIHPGAVSGRIRSLQSHETDRPSVEPGSRVAANLAGLERSDLARGAMLGHPGDWVPSGRLLVGLRNARYVSEPLTDRGAYHLHLGSGAWPVRLRVLGPTPAGNTAAVLVVEQALPVQVGDRFVLREVGRRTIVAGGRVLDPVAARAAAPARESVALLEPVLDAAPDAVAEALLASRGIGELKALHAHSGGGKPLSGVEAGGVLMVAERAAALREKASGLVSAYHTANPLRPGMPKASLASQIDVGIDALSAILAAHPAVAEHGSVVASTDFSARLDDDAEATWDRVRTELVAAGLMVPRLADLGVDGELVHALVREQRLVKISNDFAYLPEQLDDLVSRLADLPDRFTVAQFRDALGLTRKYAVPLVEWLDSQRITLRHGDERSLVG